MRIRTIEEVHEGIVAGELDLSEFQAWLALWAVQIMKVLDDDSVS